MILNRILLEANLRQEIENRIRFAKKINDELGGVPGGYLDDNTIAVAKKIARNRDMMDWVFDHILFSFYKRALDYGKNSEHKPEIEKRLEKIGKKYDGLLPIIMDVKRFLSDLEHLFLNADKYQPLRDYRFETKDTNTAFRELEQLNKTYQEKINKTILPDEIQPEDEILIEFPDGSAWFLLPREACSIEARKMGHCGNTVSPKEGERLLSYRTKEGDGWVPHLTFLIDKDGYLVELKGRNNQKPSKKYNDVILALLKHPIIKGFGIPKYDAGSDWSLDMLEPEQIEELGAVKPEIMKTFHELKLRTLPAFIEHLIRSKKTLEDFVSEGSEGYPANNARTIFNAVFDPYIEEGYILQGDDLSKKLPPNIFNDYFFERTEDLLFDIHVVDIDKALEETLDVLKKSPKYFNSFLESLKSRGYDGDKNINEIKDFILETFDEYELKHALNLLDAHAYIMEEKKAFDRYLKNVGFDFKTEIHDEYGGVYENAPFSVVMEDDEYKLVFHVKDFLVDLYRWGSLPKEIININPQEGEIYYVIYAPWNIDFRALWLDIIEGSQAAGYAYANYSNLDPGFILETFEEYFLDDTP